MKRGLNKNKDVSVQKNLLAILSLLVLQNTRYGPTFKLYLSVVSRSPLYDTYSSTCWYFLRSCGIESVCNALLRLEHPLV